MKKTPDKKTHEERVFRTFQEYKETFFPNAESNEHTETSQNIGMSIAVEVLKNIQAQQKSG